MKRLGLIIIAFGLGGLGLAAVLALGPVTAVAAPGGEIVRPASAPKGTVSRAIVADVPLTMPLLSEGFETWPPGGWLLHTDEPFGAWGWTSAYTHTGDYAAFHAYPPGKADSWLVTPPVTPTAVSELVFWQLVKFLHRYDKHSIWVSTQRQDPRYNEFVQLAEITPTPELTWEEVRIDLSAYAGQPIYVAFRYEGDKADEWYIDDVQITAGLAALYEGSPFPGEVITLTASAASGRNASFAWDFGDGNFGSGEVISHTYDDSGDYTVILTATNSVSVLTDTITITVKSVVYLPMVLRE